MRHLLPFLAALVLIPFVFVSCADEQVDDADEELEIVATAQWKCGRTMASRAGTDPITITEADYPQLLHVTVGNGDYKQLPATHPANFIIGKTLAGNDTPDFTAYHDQYRIEKVRFGVSGLHAVLDEGNSTKELRSLYSKGILTGLRVEANTLSPRYDGSSQSKIPQAWDNLDIPDIGRIDHLTTKPAFGGETRIEGKHLFLTLGHVSAMLRLHFAVSADYSKLRYIDLKSVTINGNELTKEDPLVLKTEATPIPPATKNYDQHQLFAFTYIKPSHDYKGNAIITIPSTPLGAEKTAWTSTISTTTPLTFKCTYDIYDKDANNDAAHLTRRDVTATNQITLGNLFAKDGSSVTAIRAGHYYDLYITINPDYLYVLSEHDNNKHLKIQ